MNDLGKIPPQSIDSELAVLGMILSTPTAINEVAAILTPDMFYKSAHQVIYEAAMDVYSGLGKIDLITVMDKLRASGKLEATGGPMYLAELTSSVCSAAMVEHYAMLIKEKYVLREYIRTGHEIISSAYDEDLDKTAEIAEDNILKISGSIHIKEPKFVGDITERVLTQIQKVCNHEIKLIGVPSGFTTLDRNTGGFKSGEMVIIAGRPSMGKTAFALQLAKNMAVLNTPVAIFSCEMEEDELSRRMISMYSGLSNMALINGHCNPEEVNKQIKELYTLPILIDDTSNIGLIELRSKTRKMIIKYGIKAILVDYIGLMRSEGYNRENEISKLSAGLKSIAKDLDIAVIVLSQLNREVDKRADKKPQLSDLRDSGSLEQDGDMVVFVRRLSKYGITTDNVAGVEMSTTNLMVVDLAKNRNGACGEIPLTCNEWVTEIKDYENEAPC